MKNFVAEGLNSFGHFGHSRLRDPKFETSRSGSGAMHLSLSMGVVSERGK
jgi:hypothetical protein